MLCFPRSQYSYLSWVTLLLACVFLFSASIPGTVALRYFLLLFLLLIAAYRPELKRLWEEQAVPVSLLGVFVAWGLFHCAFISLWPKNDWGEFSTQVLLGVLWFFVGVVLFRRRYKFTFFDITIAAGTLLALVEFIHDAFIWLKTGDWPFMQTYITVTHLEFTFIMNLVLAFVLASLCFGFRASGRKVTCIPRWALVLIAVLMVFVSLRAGARNGMIGLVYLIISLLVVYILINRKHLSVSMIAVVSLAVIAVVAGLSVYSFRADSRNTILMSSLRSGWNYQNSTAWFDDSQPLPFIPGTKQQVDDSAYKRLAWIRKGSNMIVYHPLGFGYERAAFGHALIALKYKNAHFTQAHSGFIDLGVQLGVPGIVLWLAFCFSLIIKGYRYFVKNGDVFGLVLALVSCGFIGRMLIESIMRDHMLYLFLFISAALLAEMRRRNADSVSAAQLNAQ